MTLQFAPEPECSAPRHHLHVTEPLLSNFEVYKFFNSNQVSTYDICFPVAT